VESLHRDTTRRIGLGAATTTDGVVRHFLFHLGVGFDAAIIRRMEARSYLKRHFAHPAFALATVDTWLRHFDRHQAIRLVVDVGAGSGAEVVAAGPYAVISNSDPYTYVGRRPMTIAPNAALDDALAVTVLTDLGGMLLARTAASSIGTAAYLEASPRIVQISDVVGAEVRADAPFPWQVDGDYLGDVDRLTVAYRPDCLTIVTP
jgi:diacylglycerol kinase family enzyme